MRTIHFMILILALAARSNSQDYLPFPESNASWSVVWTMPSPEYYSQHYKYLLIGDTLINDMEYIKINKLGLEVLCSKDTVYNIYIGAYRNDTLSKQVQFVPSGYQEEQLLYDFSLNIGDIVPQSWQNLLYPNLVVESIDTVIIEGIARRRFTYWNTPDPLNLRFYVFEGFGSDWGLLEDYDVIENPYYLKCFISNDSLNYMHPGDTTCILETDTCIYTNIISLNNSNSSYFKVYSSKNQVVIEHNFELKNLSLLVFDLNGDLRYKTEVSSNKFALNKSQFCSSLYFFMLQKENQILKVNKIIFNL